MMTSFRYVEVNKKPFKRFGRAAVGKRERNRNDLKDNTRGNLNLFSAFLFLCYNLDKHTDKVK